MIKLSRVLAVVLAGSISVLTVRAQIGPSNEYDSMVKDSDIILIGKIKSISQVVHKNKISAPTNSAAPTLPNPNEYVIGNEFSIEIKDWIKGESKVKNQKDVRILVLGRVPGHGDPILTKDTEYLLFLKQIVEGDVLEDAATLEFSKDGAVNFGEFKAEKYYSVNGGLTGSIKGEKKIKEVRRKIKEE